MSQIAYPARFNGVSLTTVPGLTVLSTDPYKLPRRNVSMTQIARTNYSKVNSGFYVERLITVKVGITRANRAQLEQSIDSLMALLQGIDKELVIDQAGSERVYYATLADAPVDKDGGSYIEISLVFTCTDRFGYDIGATTLLSIVSAYTSASRSDRLEFRGSAKTQAPVITLTFASITNGSNKTVTVGNGETGQQLSITRNWLSADRLEIDTLNETIRVNNTDVNFSGAIPKWAVGFGYWSYADNFDARSFTGSIMCRFRYS